MILLSGGIIDRVEQNVRMDMVTIRVGANDHLIARLCKAFGGGGSDIPSKYDKNLFGGGAGAGVSIKPEGFLVVSPDGNARMVRMETSGGAIDTVIDKFPDIVSYVSSFIGKKKGDDEEVSAE